MNSEKELRIGNSTSWCVCNYGGKIYSNCYRIDENTVELSKEDLEQSCKKTLKMKKIVSLDKITSYYRINCSVIYNGALFEPIELNQKAIKEGMVFISTNQCELVKSFELKCYDKMRWGKYISIEDIEGIILEREYLFGEKCGMREMEEKGKEDLIDYLTNSPEMR